MKKTGTHSLVNAQTEIGICFVLENQESMGILFRSMTDTDTDTSADTSTDTDKPEGAPIKPDELTILDEEALSRYVTDTGKILPRKYTRLSPKQQRRISRLIKKGRHMQTLK